MKKNYLRSFIICISVLSLFIADSCLAALTPPQSGFAGVPQVGKYFYHHDELDSTILMTDVDGNLITYYDYYPFGEINQTSSYGVDLVREKFTGKELDTNNGIGEDLYYFGARYYDPSIGKFITPDPDGQFFDPYMYAGDNPESEIDPNGNWAGAIVSGITSGAYSFVDYQINQYGSNISDWHFTDDSDAYMATAKGAVNGAVEGLIFKSFGTEAVATRAFGNGAAGLGKLANRMSNKSITSRLERTGGGCASSFVAGTEVSVDKDKYILIEDVKSGSEVLAYDEKGDKVVKAIVGDIFQRVVSERMVINTKNDVIETTSEHPFYIKGKGWIKAKDLKINDSFFSADEFKEVKIKDIKKIAGEIKVYNFSVDGYHNYFVSSDKILVHNAGCLGSFTGDLRSYTVGATPSKSSPTGKLVFAMMAGTDKKTKRSLTGKMVDYVRVQLDDSGKRGWVKLTGNARIHMGHTVDAVRYWNTTLRRFPPDEIEAETRAWMLDPGNYQFEWGPLNSSHGARLGMTYLPPDRWWPTSWPPAIGYVYPG